MKKKSSLGKEMPLHFKREYRTEQSELFSIFDVGGKDCLGRIDVHYLPDNFVTGLCCLFNQTSDEEVMHILHAFDELVVNMADLKDGNFQMEVYSVGSRRAFGTKKRRA